MSLLIGIQQARAHGYKSSDAMPPHVKRLKRALNRFVHPERFGKFYAAAGESAPGPKHANGPNARYKDTFSFVRLARTLEAARENGWFHFYKSRPDSPVFLLMLDLDLHAERDGGGGESDAWELALLILEREFGGHYDKVWCATSRNGRGFYVYFMVANPTCLKDDQRTTVEQFAARLRDYNRYLRATYNDVPHRFNGETKAFRSCVDAVKGSPWHVDWARFERGDRRITNEGTLATIPLTGVRAGPEARDPFFGRETIETFCAWAEDWRAKAFPPSFFFDKLPAAPPPSSQSQSSTTLPSSSTETDMGTEASVLVPGVQQVRGGGTAKDPTAGEEIDRMNACGWNLSQQQGRAATAAEIWAAYHDQHLNTGPDHDGNRWRLCATAARWLDLHFKTGARFDADHYRELIAAHVSEAARARVRKTNRSGYSDEDLAVVLYAVERGSLTRHRTPRHQFTVGNDSLTAMFAKLGRPLGGEGGGSGEANRKKLSAMKRVLVEAGLISVVSAAWCVGVSKKYGLGPNHPRFGQFTAFAERIGRPVPPIVTDRE